MLLCQVDCRGGADVGEDEPVDTTGQVSLEAAEDLFARASLGSASDSVGARLWVVDEPVVGDRPERVVALPVAALVESAAAAPRRAAS
jgi:hypothetical protein